MRNYQRYKHTQPADEAQVIRFALEDLPEQDRKTIQGTCEELQKHIGGFGAVSAYELLYKIGRAISTHRLTIKAK